MKIEVIYKERAAAERKMLVENFTSNKVTFPAEFPYMIIGAFPKVTGKSHEIFLPDIKELVIRD